MYTFIRIAFSNTSTGRNCMMSRQKLAIHQLSTTVFFDDFLKMFGSLLKLVKYQIESCCNDGVVEKKAGKGYTWCVKLSQRGKACIAYTCVLQVGTSTCEG